jgi:hypothetical protein
MAPRPFVYSGVSSVRAGTLNPGSPVGTPMPLGPRRHAAPCARWDAKDGVVPPTNTLGLVREGLVREGLAMPALGMDPVAARAPWPGPWPASTRRPAPTPPCCDAGRDREAAEGARDRPPWEPGRGTPGPLTAEAADGVVEEVEEKEGARPSDRDVADGDAEGREAANTAGAARVEVCSLRRQPHTHTHHTPHTHAPHTTQAQNPGVHTHFYMHAPQGQGTCPEGWTCVRVACGWRVG